MKNLRVLLDLDCVLADFVSGAASAHGVSPGELYPHWPAGSYGMDHPLGLAKGLGRGLTAEEFWAPLNGGNGFWADLPELPWARSLVNHVRRLTDDWWVVTSPSECDHCIPEKARWLRRFFGVSWFSRMIPTGAKHLLANPSTVLIDDHERNTDSFHGAGGHGVLFPAHHNRFHEAKNEPLEHVVPAVGVLARVLSI